MIPTPHLSARQGDIAKTVLMPGDPLRAKFIAENFLEDTIQYNEVRGMLGFTGTYKGISVSIQGSGMGIPSMGIYSHELYNFYNVENIIRVGTAGALKEDLDIGDVIIAMGACTDSNFVSQYGLPGTFASIASWTLMEKAFEVANTKKISVNVGNVLTSDNFYGANKAEDLKKWQSMGVLAVEMETAGLYTNAAYLGKNALSILTVSDCVFTNKAADSYTRQTTFTRMAEIALETAIKL